MPEINEEIEVEKSSKNSILPIIIGLISLLLLISSFFVWLTRRDEDGILSPWEIGGELDEDPIELKEVELDPKDVVDLLQSDNTE